MKHRNLIALTALLALLAVAIVPAFASGPVYDDLPDLEGAEIVIAVENQYVPFQFNDSRQPDEAIGFEYDVVNEACRRINCVPVYENTTFELQLSGVANGDYDMAMNGLFVFPDREEAFDFSTPYLESGTYLLGRAGEDRFDSIESFIENSDGEDLIFGVQANSFGQEIASSFYEVPEDRIVTFNEFGALLLALENGDIDTMVVDAFAGNFVGVNAERYQLVGERLVDPLDIALLFQKDSDYDEAFSAAIESMKADGYLDYLFYKWSVDFQPVSE